MIEQILEGLWALKFLLLFIGLVTAGTIGATSWLEAHDRRVEADRLAAKRSKR